MVGYEGFVCGFGWWWIFPIAMIVLCLFMMWRGKGCLVCWANSRVGSDTHPAAFSDSAGEILDKRYALGEIGKEEYEEKKKDIDQTIG